MIDHGVSQTADAVDGHWVYRRAPAVLRPWLKLARADRPVGTWLLLWPCWWSVALGAAGWPNPLLLALFALGSLVMRGAGCTYNDIVDRNFDARVERTALRPLPAGEVSLLGAWIFLGLQCLAGLCVLLVLQFFFSPYSIWFGFGALALVAIYPFMKRITFWPQAWLGLTFNWGALMAFLAATGGPGWPAFALYCGAIFWTLGYDTIYAHQDREDDALIGVKSTAIKLGDASPAWITGFYGFFLLGLILSGMLAHLGPIYYVGLILAAVHLVSQVRRMDVDNPETCLSVFRSNISFGWIIFMSLVADKVAGL